MEQKIGQGGMGQVFRALDTRLHRTVAIKVLPSTHVADPDRKKRFLLYYHRGKSMSDVISEYQKWKQQGDDLRLKAKQAMESRFRELLSEAAQIAGEYRADFGTVLKPPSPVTAFRYRAHAKAKTKKAGKPTAAGKIDRTPSQVAPAPQKPDPKIGRLQHGLANTRRKLEEAKAAGKPTRPLEDRIYEIEDALRLAGQTS